MNPFSDNKESAKEVIRAWWTDEFLEFQFRNMNFMPPKPGLFSAVSESDTYGPYFGVAESAGHHRKRGQRGAPAAEVRTGRRLRDGRPDRRYRGPSRRVRPPAPHRCNNTELNTTITFNNNI